MLNNINNYILLILINTMGRGAAAAHAAYNGSGTQGISVTNEINENEDIHSVFITQNDTSKQILHGHNISEMTCSGKTGSIESERFKIFTPDENSDMLGDIYLNFEMDSEISDFEFVDTTQSNSSYPLQDLSQEDLTTSFTVAGAELKSMELDLTTREVPPVESLTLNMRTVNKIKTFEYSATIVQFAVGRDDNYNVAWRYYGSSEYTEWYYMKILQFVEVNDVIYDPLFNPGSSALGSIIFGGCLLEQDDRGKKSGLYLMTISDFNTPNTTNTLQQKDVYELSILRGVPGTAQKQNSTISEADLAQYSHYITVNALTYLPGTGFIASGRKYFDENELKVIIPEYGWPARNDFAQIQTSIIFRNDTTDYSKYNTNDLSFDLIHNGLEDRQKFTSNPEVTSKLSIVENGITKTVLACGSRYNTILGLDEDGLIIKSYDNGKTWEHSDFYYGSDKALEFSEEGGQIYSVSITNSGSGYTIGDVVTFEQAGATSGRGIVTAATPIDSNGNGGGLSSVSVTEGGFGYVSDNTVVVKRVTDDYSGDAIGTISIEGHISSIYITNAGSGYAVNDLVKFVSANSSSGTGYVTEVNSVGGIVSLKLNGGGSYIKDGTVTISNDASLVDVAEGVVTEVCFKRISAAFDYTSRSKKTFDKGLYDNSQDQDFSYYMPVVSKLHTNNTGVWTAIGQQGLQNSSRTGNNRYRQFVFRSIDDGETWHPIRVHAFPNKREINHVQFNSVHVDYISIYTTDREACKILMSVPPSTLMASIFERSNWASHWGISGTDDLSASNNDAVPGKSYVLLNVPSTLTIPWLGDVAANYESNVLASLRSTSHRLTPWFRVTGSTAEFSNNSGLYDLDYFENLNEDPHISNGEVRYEYLGAISDRKRDILFGKHITTEVSGQTTVPVDVGIVTILATKGEPSDQGSSAYHLRYPIKTVTIKFGKLRIIQNIVSTFLGMTAVLKDSNNSLIKYEIIYSYDGLEWKTLQNINNSTEVPIIQSDITGNIIYSYKTTNEYQYKIFKISPAGEYSEINVLNNVFTEIKGLNYAGTEWLITGTDSDGNHVAVKSYDTVKWRKPNINNYPVISSIVIKEKRLYETLVELQDTGGTTTQYKKGNFRTYEVCHSDYRTNFQGLGVRAYGLQDLDFSSGNWATGIIGPALKERQEILDKSIKINSLDETITNSSTTSANDIFQLRDGTIIMCGESTHIYNGGSYQLHKSNDGGYDYIVLAEGPGADGLTFTEVRTIYKSLAGDYMGITNLANSFQSLHKVHFSEFNHLAIGKNLYGNGSDGLLALRHIPDPKEFTGLTQTYYWKFVFGTNDPSINNSTTDDWTITPFETIHDVYTNNLREIVVVGKPKSGNSPIYYERPDNLSLKTFRNEWTKISADYHGFSEVLSVCYTGTRWVFVGIPNNLVQNDGKILAHTTDLLDPNTWVIVDFSHQDNEKPFNIVKKTDNTLLNSYYDKEYFINVSDWRGNHVRPVNYKGKSCVIINVSFYDGDVPDITAYDRLQEKVYFMYDNNGEIDIQQNFSYPEPRIMYRDLIRPLPTTPPYETKKHGGEQFRPTWETYIDGSLRTVFTTVYPSEFNQFLVDLNADGYFVLRHYANPFTEDSFASMGNSWQRRYRKFITTDTFSLRNRIEGNCYKIEQVKNENFITGVDSARYLAVGKGISSPIVKSDDLINWTDVDVKDIFTIVFDISHKSGLWVAVGEGNYNLAISKDGKNWTGIYTKYQSETLSSDYSTAFNSLDYYDDTDNNVTDILPYVPNLKGIFLRNLSLLRLFSRIEYHVGTQIWQTLTFDDIKAMLDTEIGAGEYAKLLKNCSIINKNGSTRITTWIPGFTKTLNSKLETFSNISESGSFPSGLLKDQKLSIKIYYNKLENVIGNELTSSDMNNSVFDNFMINTLIPADRDANYYIDSFLADNYGFQLGDTYRNVNGHFELNYSTEIKNLRLYSKNFELDDIEINEFNKGVTQMPKITQSLYFDAYNTGNLNLDLDSFNLYASHIIVSGWLTSNVYIKDMNLELNGHTYQKIIEPSVIDYATKSYLGLNYNRYTFNGVDKEDGTGSLVIPLASTAYSGSSVPLDRYDSIRLRINFNTFAGPKSYINVTCVGTTTVSYNNNTANIDLY